MVITVAEFKERIEYYLDLVGKEEIIITRDGHYIVQLVPPPVNKEELLRSLCGILPPTATLEEAREARLAKHTKHWNETE